jgi:hypothetical protein
VAVDYDSGAIGNSFASEATFAGHWTGLTNWKDIRADQVILEGLVENANYPVYDTSNAILLGTIQFQAGTLGNVTNLDLSLNNVTPFANLLAEYDEWGFPIEVSPISFRSGTISAVPEPSSLVLIALPIAAGFCRKLKTKRKHT